VNVALLLLLYLLIASIVLAMWVMPEWRHAVVSWTLRRVHVWQRQALSTASRVGGPAERALRAPVTLLERLRSWSVRQWGVVGAALAVLLLPPLAAYWLGEGRMLEGFDERRGVAIDPHVAALLQGEHLVPPPPLPPEVFTTREVEAERPGVALASREWALLDADFAQRLLLVFKLMREQHGYEMALLEGYRSPERQEQLRGQGGHVTHAGAFQSYHQFGLAADCAFYRDGKLVISEKDPWAARGYQLYGQVAESVGLTWGGRWRTIVDLGHVELRRPGVMKPAAKTP